MAEAKGTWQSMKDWWDAGKVPRLNEGAKGAPTTTTPTSQVMEGDRTISQKYDTPSGVDQMEKWKTPGFDGRVTKEHERTYQKPTAPVFENQHDAEKERLAQHEFNRPPGVRGTVWPERMSDTERAWRTEDTSYPAVVDQYTRLNQPERDWRVGGCKSPVVDESEAIKRGLKR